LGNSFGKQLRGTALGSSFGKLSGTILRNNCFEEQQLLGGSFTNHIGEQLSAATLGSSFRAVLVNGFAESQLWGATALENSFGEQLWGTTLGSSFGEQLWGAALDSFPEQLLRNTCFEEQQLLGIYLQGTSGSSFQSQLWVGSCFREHFWEQLWGPALWLWRAALGQIRGLALESSGEQLCE